MKPQVTVCTALVLVILPGLKAGAAPPAPNLANIGGYLQSLEHSQDPAAAMIRQEIAAGPAALAKEKADAAQHGIDLSLAVLQRPLPPVGQNAAVLYQQLDQLRQEKPLGLPKYAEALDSNYAYTPAQLAAVQQIVDQRPDVFKLLTQAAQMPQYVVSKDWSLGETVRFQEFAGMREDARELVTLAYLSAYKGNVQKAVADQSLGFSVARQTGSEPPLIATLVAIAIEEMSLRGMQNILYMAGPNADADTAVEHAVAADTPNTYPPLSRIMIAEAALGVSQFQSLRQDPASIGSAVDPPVDQSPPLTPSQLQLAHDFIDAAEAHYLSLMLPQIEQSEQPGFTLSPGVNSALNLEENVPDSFSSPDPVTALDAGFLFNYQQIRRRGTGIHAGEQVTMAAAAILAARANAGAFPAALPGSLIDPFNGKQLGYRREGTDGFVVFSVGRSGTFDGGQPGQYEFSPYEDFFRYPAPPKKPVPTDMLQ